MGIGFRKTFFRRWCRTSSVPMRIFLGARVVSPALVACLQYFSFENQFFKALQRWRLVTHKFTSNIEWAYLWLGVCHPWLMHVEKNVSICSISFHLDCFHVPLVSFHRLVWNTWTLCKHLKFSSCMWCINMILRSWFGQGTLSRKDRTLISLWTFSTLWNAQHFSSLSSSRSWLTSKWRSMKKRVPMPTRWHDSTRRALGRINCAVSLLYVFQYYEICQWKKGKRQYERQNARACSLLG